MAIRRAISDTVQVTDWSRDIPGKCTEDRMTWLFPVVRGNTRCGRETKWLISLRIFPDEHTALAGESARVITREIAINTDMTGGYIALIRIHYQIGDGVIQIRTPTIVSEGKKRGTVAETNIFCQALRDAFSLYNKQRRRAGDIPNDVRPLPMLAQCYKDVYPHADIANETIYVQRKYNGVRAIGTIDGDNGILYSRVGLLYSGFNVLRANIARICIEWRAHHNDEILHIDGELYKHGSSLQEISGIVRRVRDNDESDSLTFVVYDLFIMHNGIDIPMTFARRMNILREIGAQDGIELAETFTCEGAQVMNCARGYYDQFLREGYEGAIIRLDREYEHSINARHSQFLLKMKPTYDAEFNIVGWTIGDKGRARGALLFICNTQSGHEFNVTPTGAIETRIAMAREFARIESNGRSVFENRWRGRALIVKYDELSLNGVPQRARTDSEIRELP